MHFVIHTHTLLQPFSCTIYFKYGKSYKKTYGLHTLKEKKKCAWSWPYSCITKYTNNICSYDTFYNIYDHCPVREDSLSWKQKTKKGDGNILKVMDSWWIIWKLCLANTEQVQQSLWWSSTIFKVRNVHVFHQEKLRTYVWFTYAGCMRSSSVQIGRSGPIGKYIQLSLLHHEWM